jgi:hypothetical protein
MSGGSTSTAKSSNEHIWALLIGIENYTELLPGARADIEAVRAWLLERGTPEGQIRVLLDEEATRVSILDTFEHHLVSNNAIPRDAPIFLYYSGHGAQVETPSEWTSEDETGPAFTELIVPQDAIDAGNELIPDFGIPDKTIGALLRRLSRVKGNNITGTRRPPGFTDTSAESRIPQ